MRFCPTCDLAVSEQEVNQARVDHICPRCKESRLSDFYALGSYTHKARRMEWEEGLIVGAPLPIDHEEDWSEL